MVKILILSLFCLIFSIENHGQRENPKREFRGTWVATVANIDWPSSYYLSSEEQIDELHDLFIKLRFAGINAVIFQVRTECDALYNSSYEPWSYWLTGQQGKAPDPFYDPLEIAVREAHSLGMELHAWFNPYRAVKSFGDYEISNFHVSKMHPDWILTFNDYKMLNPGIPEVNQYIVSIVEEVIKNYDIDGIHFDDYFYPYSPKISNEDSVTFVRYSSGFMNIDDWRRNNINELVRLVHEKIEQLKPHIKFGISPFGIVENKYAGTNGFNSYSILYCDPLTWIKEKTVDYVTPQIYWEIGHKLADYSLLLPWWSSIAEDRHLYIGQFASRFASESYAGKKSEIGDQLRLNKEFGNVKGSIFFSAKAIAKNYSGFADSLRNEFYKSLVLVPLMSWKDSTKPNAPQSLTVTKRESCYHLQWEKSTPAVDGDSPRYFVIYFSYSIDNIYNPENILEIVPGDRLDFDYCPKSFIGDKVFFSVTALDKVQNESDNNQAVLVD